MAVKAIRFMPQVPQFKENVKLTARLFYPDELKITVVGKKIKTNVKEPYVIEIPNQPTNSTGQESVAHFITIDTQGAVENYAKYKTAILVTDSLVIIPDNQPSKTYKVLMMEDLLKNVPEGSVLDKNVYTKVTEPLFPYLDYLPLVIWITIALALLIFPFVGAALGLSWQLLRLLGLALLVFIAAKIMKKKFSYRETYRLSMHGVTIPIVLSLLFRFPGFNLGIINTLIFVVFMTVVISKLDSRS